MREDVQSKKDQIRLEREIGPGRALCTRRHEDGTIMIGTVTKMKNGQPIDPDSELVTLSESDGDGWHDVNVLYKSEANGPPQVATDEYKRNYDRIFGTKRKVARA